MFMKMTISLLHKDHYSVNKEGKIIFTFSDLQKLPEWPVSPLLEIINGELFMVPSPTLNHQDIVLNLAIKIKEYLTMNNIGRIWIAPVDVILSETDVVIPDLVFISDKNTVIDKKNIKGTPDLLIEVLSTNKNHDLLYKKDLYEQYGVKEYWIIDPFEKSMLVYKLKNTKFDGVKLINDDLFRSTILQGFELNINSIFVNPS